MTSAGVHHAACWSTRSWELRMSTTEVFFLYSHSQTMDNRTYDKILMSIYVDVKDDIIKNLKLQHAFIGGQQPFLALQSDFTTTYNTSYVTLSVSFVNADYKFQRYMLATRDFPGSHTGEQVRGLTSYARK
jgi:hypothetical protein